jgi:hypothetical protein
MPADRRNKALHEKNCVIRCAKLAAVGPAHTAADPAAAAASDGPLPMTDDNNTAIDAIQIDEDILSYTVSDEALEAAAGTERGDFVLHHTTFCTGTLDYC